jgi:NAD+ diphosphatase
MTSAAPVNTFAGNPLDRCGDRRRDPVWLAARLAQAEAEALAIWRGKPLVRQDGEGDTSLARLRASHARDMVQAREERLLFLGLDRGVEGGPDDGVPVFAVEFEGEADPALGPLEGLGRFEELRSLAAVLPGAEAAIAGCAKSLFDWRTRHRFCAACGNESALADGGWKRVCPACRAEHFPRVDPVTIMLPWIGDRCLLGRQAAWPEGRMSALAGFLEPGESIEESCAREVKEESGLTAVRVTYHSSQPWPFPASLMIGLFAEVADDLAAPDEAELEAVRWFTRAEIKTMLAEGRYDGISPAPPIAIARQLLEAWARWA